LVFGLFLGGFRPRNYEGNRPALFQLSLIPVSPQNFDCFSHCIAITATIVSKVNVSNTIARFNFSPDLRIAQFQKVGQFSDINIVEAQFGRFAGSFCGSDSVWDL
jgi:hypothetical protein